MAVGLALGPFGGASASASASAAGVVGSWTPPPPSIESLKTSTGSGLAASAPSVDVSSSSTVNEICGLGAAAAPSLVDSSSSALKDAVDDVRLSSPSVLERVRPAVAFLREGGRRRLEPPIEARRRSSWACTLRCARATGIPAASSWVTSGSGSDEEDPRITSVADRLRTRGFGGPRPGMAIAPGGGPNPGMATAPGGSLGPPPPGFRGPPLSMASRSIAKPLAPPPPPPPLPPPPPPT
mmetsp:Transcript_30542/g.79988  ORF Transcript_30542/g.79988 Transcript_30542/m.79988 type:complete len:239 (-) Transcript_30542:926-1642(-)